MSLHGKTVLITGIGKPGCNSSSTDGLDVARRLAAQGVAALALHFNTTSAQEIQNGNKQVQLIQMILYREHPSLRVSLHAADLGVAADIERVFSCVAEQHGRIDVVVNAAGQLLQRPASSAGADYHRLLAYAIFVEEQHRRTVSRLHAEMSQISAPS